MLLEGKKRKRSAINRGPFEIRKTAEPIENSHIKLDDSAFSFSGMLLFSRDV